jgi:hypothetical protein
MPRPFAKKMRSLQIPNEGIMHMQAHDGAHQHPPKCIKNLQELKSEWEGKHCSFFNRAREKPEEQVCLS